MAQSATLRDDSPPKTLTFDTPQASTASLSGSGVSAFPSFDLGRGQAEVAKNAGRLNAAAIPPEEERALVERHRQLVAKKLAGTITKNDAAMLAYVRWSLDRIADAKHGDALDRLEGQIRQYEDFAESLQRFEQQLRHEASRRR